MILHDTKMERRNFFGGMYMWGDDCINVKSLEFRQFRMFRMGGFNY